MTDIRIMVRPSTRMGSDYWAVEKNHICFVDDVTGRVSFTVHNIRWFKNKRLAVSWAKKHNPKNYPIKIGYA